MESSRPPSQQRDGSVRARSLPRKQASFDTTRLTITSSPPLTSSLHSRHSASSAQESAYLGQAWWLRWIRLVLAVLVVGTGSAALGCTAHTLHQYNATHLGSDWFLPLWPRNIDVKPTIAILVPAVIMTATSLTYLLFAILPSPRSRTLILNIFFGLVAISGLAVSIFAVVYNAVLVHDVDPDTRESLQSYTCKFYRGARSFMSDAHKLQIPVYGSVRTPGGFGRICLESEAAFGLTVALLCLEVVSCVVAGVGIWLERRIAKIRNDRQNEKWHI